MKPGFILINRQTWSFGLNPFAKAALRITICALVKNSACQTIPVIKEKRK